jgi:hypothetical protein
MLNLNCVRQASLPFALKDGPAGVLMVLIYLAVCSAICQWRF